jgi:hypothetical protein
MRLLPEDRKKHRKIGIAIGILLLLPLLLLLHPRSRTALRLTSGFVPLEQDERIYYETGAEVFARRVAAALPGAIARVEAYQLLPFKTEFRVYVCSSHESFTRRIGQPATDPVRGISFPWDIWISPLAFEFFGRDTHRQTIIHELSHLHLDQHLGWWQRMRGVPWWFQEGLADWVADTGEEIVSRHDAVESLRYGHHFVPETTGRLSFFRSPQEYGLTWPMFHRQSRMFVEYLLERDGRAFKGFLKSLIGGARFDLSFRRHYGRDLEVVWRDFLENLESDE